MDLPAEPLISNRRFFHEVPMSEKAFRSPRGQRLVGIDGSCLGGGNAGHQ
jgi:hypothetical protein